jgi:hypothetical protein
MGASRIPDPDVTGWHSLPPLEIRNSAAGFHERIFDCRGHDCEDQFLAEVLRGMGISGQAMTSAMFLGAAIKRRDRRLFLEKAYQYSQPVLRIVQSGTRAGERKSQHVTLYFSSDWPRVRRGYQAVRINLVSCAADRHVVDKSLGATFLHESLILEDCTPNCQE